MNFHTIQSNRHSYNPYLTKFMIPPNKVVTLIEPSNSGKLIPTEPVFFYRCENDYIEDEAEFSGLRDKPEYKNKLIVSKSNENAIIANYCQVRLLHGPVESLSVILIGNEEVPDVSAYAPTVTSIEFDGHLSYIRPAFHIVRQLPFVNRVKFFIGRSQLPIFNAGEVKGIENDIEFRVAATCPYVESLEIVMDMDCYYDNPWFCNITCYDCGKLCHDLIKNTFDLLIESLLKVCKECFPNLTHLYTNLPDSDIYQGGVSSLIESSRFLKNKTRIYSIEGPLSADMNVKTIFGVRTVRRPAISTTRNASTQTYETTDDKTDDTTDDPNDDTTDDPNDDTTDYTTDDKN